MKELRFPGEHTVVEDIVADALDALASALGESGMGASIEFRAAEPHAAIRVESGHARSTKGDHILHAKSATRESSHFPFEEF